MPGEFARSLIVVVGLLLAGGGALRAETAERTPAKTAHTTTPRHADNVVRHKPVAHPASRTAAHRTPLIRAKPGPSARPPAAAPKPAAAPAPPPAVPEEPMKGSNTGLPLPRFVSLKSNDVNMRSGPGTRYPIEWVYHRRDLPMEVEREFEVWRLVEDKDGVKGWVHQAVLISRRTAVVLSPKTGGKGGEEQVMRSGPQADAAAVARLKPGVILRVRACAAGADWCQVSIQDYRGWIRRAAIWGTLPGEAVQ